MSDVSPDRLLRGALRANAAFSALSGATSLILARRLAPWMGIADATFLPSLGVNLLVFAAFLVWLASRAEPRRGLVAAVIAMDVAWVAGSAVVLGLGVLSVAGAWTVAMIADVVGAFAILQYLGLRRVRPLASEAART